MLPSMPLPVLLEIKELEQEQLVVQVVTTTIQIEDVATSEMITKWMMETVTRRMMTTTMTRKMDLPTRLISQLTINRLHHLSIKPSTIRMVNLVSPKDRTTSFISRRSRTLIF